jgi:hypothetical protein
MDKVMIRNIGTDKEVKADVLERSDKRLKVVFDGTNATLVLVRSDLRSRFVGRIGPMEFDTTGATILVKKS